MNYTFYCAKNRGLITFSENSSFAAFNTGLVDDFYKDIFGFFEKTHNCKKSWNFLGFSVWESGMGKRLSRDFLKQPDRVTYFEKLDDIFFDTDKKVTVDMPHILLDNLDRLPLEFIEKEFRAELSTDKMAEIESLFHDIRTGQHGEKCKALSTLREYIECNKAIRKRLESQFTHALNIAITRCKWNYKTAIPIFYHISNKLSLLLPIHLSGDEKAPDVSLVVEKVNEANYQGQTILTMEMAYKDARLICRPESYWLRTEALAEPGKAKLL